MIASFKLTIIAVSAVGALDSLANYTFGRVCDVSLNHQSDRKISDDVAGLIAR
jgi:hypothetical protein